MLPGAQTPSRLRRCAHAERQTEPVQHLVLREGIEPTRPPGPTVLQTAAIPFCHLSTSRDLSDIQLSKTKKERIRSELRVQKRPLLPGLFKALYFWRFRERESAPAVSTLTTLMIGELLISSRPVATYDIDVRQVHIEL